MSGDDVAWLQAQLCLNGCDAKPVDGAFGWGTAAAVKAFQDKSGMPGTGVADGATRDAVGMGGTDPTRTPVPVIDRVDPGIVGDMFGPHTSRANIARYLPDVLQALADDEMDDRDMVLMALATIRAETANFEPIDEGKSRYNSSAAGDFDLYDAGTRIGANLGNTQPGDGARFKGRGFIQLTGRHNYQRLSRDLGLGDTLIDHPENANESDIAARVLAAFLHERRSRIKYAILGRDLARARKLVNGGSHGLEAFTQAFGRGETALS